MPAPRTPRARNEPPRFRSRTIESGSSGCSLLAWIATNIASSSTPPARKPTVAEEPQPWVWALARPYTSANRPPVAVNVPGTSIRGLTAFDSDRSSGREPARAADKRPLAAEQIADPSAEQQQAAERQRVCGDDPLAIAVGEVQRLLRRGERDVHHRRVEHHHQLRDPKDREDPPAPSLATIAPCDGRGVLGCRRLCGHEDSLVIPVLSIRASGPRGRDAATA